jgi:hypothetical protein
MVWGAVADALQALHQRCVLLSLVQRGLHRVHLIHGRRVVVQRFRARGIEIAARQSGLGCEQAGRGKRRADESFHDGFPNCQARD